MYTPQSLESLDKGLCRGSLRYWHPHVWVLVRWTLCYWINGLDFDLWSCWLQCCHWWWHWFRIRLTRYLENKQEKFHKPLNNNIPPKIHAILMFDLKNWRRFGIIVLFLEHPEFTREDDEHLKESWLFDPFDFVWVSIEDIETTRHASVVSENKIAMDIFLLSDRRRAFFYLISIRFTHLAWKISSKHWTYLAILSSCCFSVWIFRFGNTPTIQPMQHLHNGRWNIQPHCPQPLTWSVKNHKMPTPQTPQAL